MKSNTLDNISSFLAELIGTGLLVFLGCMGCIKNESFPNSHLQMVINFGLVVMIMIQCFACISGAHFNPAVTLAAFIYNLITLPMAFAYFVAQMLGAFIGYGLLKTVVPVNAITTPGAAHGLCVTVPHPDITTLQALGIEMIITSILIILCCAVWDPRNAKYHDSVPLRFGFAITSLACAAGPFSGGSMNPARSFGPALWNSDFDQHWIYWVGPFVSAGITAVVFKTVFRREVIEVQSSIKNKLRAMEEVPLS